MRLFGYPLAHENDAERAGRAALSIQRALAELNRKNAGTAKPELVARLPALRHPAQMGGVELLSAFAEHAATPDRGVGPAALLRRRHGRRLSLQARAHSGRFLAAHEALKSPKDP